MRLAAVLGALVIACVFLALVLRDGEEPDPSAERPSSDRTGREVELPVAPPSGELEPVADTPSFEQVILRVVDADGEPVRSGRVDWILSIPTQVLWSMADEVVNGRASHGLPSEDRILRALVTNAVDGDLQPLGDGLSGPLEAGEAEANVVRLGPPLKVTGYVRTPDGHAAAGAVVTVRRILDGFPRPKSWPVKGLSARSERDGAFRLRGLGSSEYAILVKGQPGYLPSEPVKVRAGDSGVVLVVLRAPVVRVVDGKGKPVAGALVGLDKDGEGMSSSIWGSPTTDDRGEIRLGDVEPGATYLLRVEPPEARPDLRAIAREHWTPASESIVLPPAFAVSGVVRDTLGQPAPDAVVLTFDPVLEAWSHHPVDEWGVFRITGLPEGKIRLWAAPDSSAFDSGKGFRDVTAGDEDVVLTVPAGHALHLRVKPGTIPREFVRFTLESEESAGAGERARREGYLEGDGTVRLAALPAGVSFALHIRAEGTGECAYLRGLRAAGPEVVIRLTAPGVVRGRLAVPDGAAGPEIWLEAPALLLRGQMPGDGSFVIRDVPEGEFRLRGRALHDGRELTGQTSVRAGAVVDLLLAPR